MAITASYDGISQDLTVTGDTAGNTITVSRNAGGTLLVNNGAVAVTGGPATVAITDLVEVQGGDGADTVALDETNGALPAAELVGGAGNDVLTTGSGADTLLGEAGNDTLLGRGGIDILDGGANDDTLSGGDGDDQMFGGLGNDRMIWSPGDDSDLMEGGDGSDTAEVNGGNGNEIFTVTANGTRVRFDRLDPAPFTLDIGTTEALVLNANGGDDTMSATGNLAALITLTLDGGAGNDTILGGNGIDTLLGGDGNDFVDGNQGNDLALLGAGADTFQWDPGDGSDVVEGQGDIDTLLFNAGAASEILELSANGGRALFTRNVGNIVMDLNDVEAFTVNALGGADTVTVNDMTGTDATTVTIDLSGTVGGTTGDAAADIVTVSGTGSANAVTITGSGTSFNVAGLTAAVAVINSEGANDSLVVNGFGGDDNITATTLQAGVVKLTIDGGAGNDTIFASQGADTLAGGDANDFVFGDNGNDTAFLGVGDDVFQWEPGDGNDVIEGQAGTDELRFVGSNASENVNVAANGGRLVFTRDVAAVTMDMDDVEKIRFTAVGGSDTVTIADLTGTDATNIEVRLEGSGGGGDAAADAVAVNGTGGADAVTASSSGGVISVTGLSAAVSIVGAEGANDGLTLNGQGGDDTINASTLAAGLIALTVNGGLGSDVFFGSAGNDLFNGGDGDDTSLLGSGNDVAVWNPGDDNDTIEGQAGVDTLRFNGANVAETITISPNGGRTVFSRDVAAVTMDLNDTETIQFTALGGADTIIVGDLSATDVTQLAFDLASTPGGAVGDAQVDTLTLNGSEGGNTIALSGATGALLTVTGLPAGVTISQFESADRLTVLAQGGNDSISATGLTLQVATLTLDGGAGNDVIRSNGDGTYLGGSDDDTIFAGLTSASEVIDGGDGIDTLDTTSWGGPYTINMVTGTTNYSGESFTNFENLISGDGDDTVTGTGVANTIRTNGGTDSVDAGNGHDTVEGGALGDSLNGGLGNDTLAYDSSSAGVAVSLVAGTATGGHATGDSFAGFENLRGSAFADVLTGDAGANVLNGLGGADSLAGGLGDDSFYVDNAGDVVSEAIGQGTDRIYASVSYVLAAGVAVETLSTNDVGATTAIYLTGNEVANNLYGNFGNNVLWGGGGSDVLIAHDGNDALDGGTGSDTMAGGLGNDNFYVDNASDVVSESAGQGTDRIYASVSYVLAAGVAVETLSTNDVGATTAIYLTGNEVANNLYGNFGNNVLWGGGGSDVLIAHDGNDALDGGTGSDTMAGGLGNDNFYVDNASDVVSESAGQGTDRIYASVSYVLAAGVAVETLSTNDATATTVIDLTGNEVANAIYGNFGNNVLWGGGGSDVLIAHDGNDALDGGTGSDTMAGGLGNDNFYVDNASDVVSESAGQGTDRIYASVSYVLAAGVAVETLSTNDVGATTAIYLTRNEVANNLYGNFGNNVLWGGGGSDVLIAHDGNDALDGGTGSDTMAGGLGNDNFYVDNASDVVSESAGQGTDRIYASVSYVLAAGVAVETLSTNDVGATTAIYLTGNEEANNLYGNFGNNVLWGGGGSDVLIAHDGNDTLNGGAGADSLSGGAGADTFVFANAAGPGNIDTIGDYSVAADVIHIDNAVFTGLAVGALAAGAFNTGAAATQADDRIIYNSATGALLFDVDGVGGAAGVQFATLATGLAMSASEFLVI